MPNPTPEPKDAEIDLREIQNEIGERREDHWREKWDAIGRVFARIAELTARIQELEGDNGELPSPPQPEVVGTVTVRPGEIKPMPVRPFDWDEGDRPTWKESDARIAELERSNASLELDLNNLEALCKKQAEEIEGLEEGAATDADTINNLDEKIATLEREKAELIRAIAGKNKTIREQELEMARWLEGIVDDAVGHSRSDEGWVDTGCNPWAEDACMGLVSRNHWEQHPTKARLYRTAAKESRP